MKSLSPIIVVAACILTGCVSTELNESICCALPATVQDAAPVALGLTINKATASAGAATTVRISNTSDAPYTLQVCPAMTLCCVKGLHVMAGSSTTAMTLRDTCSQANPMRHEVFLPAGTSFEFEMQIPPEFLPEGANQIGEQIALQLCLDLTDGGRLCSQEVAVTLR